MFLLDLYTILLIKPLMFCFSSQSIHQYLLPYETLNRDILVLCYGDILSVIVICSKLTRPYTSIVIILYGAFSLPFWGKKQRETTKSNRIQRSINAVRGLRAFVFPMLRVPPLPHSRLAAWTDWLYSICDNIALYTFISITFMSTTKMLRDYI